MPAVVSGFGLVLVSGWVSPRVRVGLVLVSELGLVLILGLGKSSR